MSENRLAHLIELAKAPGSERRNLLRELTDSFLARAPRPEAPEFALYDAVMSKISRDVAEAARVELSERIAEAENAPSGLARQLATDSFRVAEAMLTRSLSLSEDDLLHVARIKGQEHLRAISSRGDLTEAVTDVIVDRGDDTTLAVLLTNDSAAFSRQSHETIVDRAKRNPALHDATVNSPVLPLDLLNEMYFVVEARLRQSILEQNANIDPEVLTAALDAGRRRVAAQDGVLPADYAQAEMDVQALKRRGELSPQALVKLLRQDSKTAFLIALAELTGIDFATASRIVESKELDALAIVCRSVQLDSALFLTFAVVILGKDGNAMGRAREYSKLYAELPQETALRTIRFWRVRRAAGDMAA